MQLLKRMFKEWILPFGLEIIAVLILIKFVFFLVIVPTGSMKPAIDEQSCLFVTHLYAPEKTVKRGDILVFWSDELGEKLIKRAVGLPGDKVVIDEEGQMYVNGEYVREDYVEFPSDRSGEWQVPEGTFLFMGDNRSGSNDARYWEEPYIPSSQVSGKAWFVLWPPRCFGFLY
ncbi:MAG: signal peptidase I [Provencibacterium sp.]|jgi:signal peptidase I|nr:signal peptidase I [Provencibacterium sp.]